MQIMEIPEKIIGDKLLQFLGWNDLLRLRRVNKWTKGLLDGYLKAHPEGAPEIEINEGKEKNFDTFTALGIPTTKIFLNNPSGSSFYGNDPEKMEDFLKDYGPLVKHLRVTKITLSPKGAELDFLEGLPNLQSFTADCFIFGKEVDTSEKAIEVAKDAMKDPHCFFMNRAFPSSFKKLKSLRIGQDREDKAIQKVALTGELLLHCPNLTSMSMPFTWTSVKPVNRMDMRGTLPGDMYFLNQYISNRPNNMFDIEPEEGPLKYYDFENYHDDYGEWDFENAKLALPENWYGSSIFLEICEKALKSGLKLRNVNPLWFCAALGKGGIYAKPEMGTAVVSLVGLDPIIMGLDMPNLEKISIPWTTRSVVGTAPKNGGYPKWPSLKCLEITVNDHRAFCWNLAGKKSHLEMGLYFDGFITEKTSCLFACFFEGGFKREGLEELGLKFKKSGRELGCLVKEIYVPRMEVIVNACPNLKRVRLGNWLGKNKQLLKLWSGLPGLEEVTLEKCKDVGDETFVGEDWRDPIFLKLKNLKKLKLIGLDQMGKVTDLLFSRVISQMTLTELVLTSDNPLKKVTKGGITALLQGPFKETIEKFPFEGWSLAKVSAEEFEELGKKFRSYDML